jgi:hypothetical protein
MEDPARADRPTAIDAKNIAHAHSVISKLRYAMAHGTTDKLAKIPGLHVSDGAVTLSLANVFGTNPVGEGAPGLFKLQITAAAPAAGKEKTGDIIISRDDGSDGGGAADVDSGDKEKNQKKRAYTSPLTEARSVFQSGVVQATLIAAAGDQLPALNEALQRAVVDRKVAVRKRRRTELHTMPTSADAPSEARLKVARVAQQIIGAVWSLTRAATPGERTTVETSMTALATNIESDPRLLFALLSTKDIFAKVIGDGRKNAFTTCGTCRSMGCRECRTFDTREASASEEEASGEEASGEEASEEEASEEEASGDEASGEEASE